MDMKGLKSFFDLGNSLSGGDDTKIGEKGHGTKVYINCDSIKVDAKKDGVHYIATMNEPKYCLLDGQIPQVHVEIDELDSVLPVIKLILEFVFLLCYTRHKERHLPITGAFHTDSIQFQKWMLPSLGF